MNWRRNMDEYYVYGHRRLDTGKIFYIGKGKGRRLTMKNHSERWKHIVEKCGYSAEKLLVNLTETQAYKWEKLLIEEYRNGGFELANIQDGGEKFSASLASKIRWSDPKERQWRIRMNKQIWSDPEKREKMLSGLIKFDGAAKSKFGKKAWQSLEYRAKFEKTYRGFISPEGKVYSPVVGIRRFARQYQLDPGELIKVHNGKRRQHKGWTKYFNDCKQSTGN